MSILVQVLFNGIGRGAIFALLALGFVIIYKATEVVNFAHGSLALFGGYLTYVLKSEVGWYLGALLGVLSAALLAFLLERLVLSRAKLASQDSLAILTIGVDIIILTEISRRLGTEAAPFLGDPYQGVRLTFLGATVEGPQIVALISALVLIGAFFAVFRYSSWGLAMRAQSENKEAAALMGIRSSRVTSSAWAVGGALAGIAILFIATLPIAGGAGLTAAHTIAFAAFPAAILGGLTSPGGAVVGGLTVGLVEAFSQQYINQDFAKVAVYLVMLIVLVARPSGLFGRVEQQRV
ncbi:MAG: branched-chain amino acid ABC transporter permease [Actinomycetota bacterium]|nr:branched-chain amino acid ABC transporter permease [Actinomycetota bacterium]